MLRRDMGGDATRLERGTNRPLFQKREDLSIPLPDGALGVIRFTITNYMDTKIEVEVTWISNREIHIQDGDRGQTMSGFENQFSDLDGVLIALVDYYRIGMHLNMISSEFRIHTRDMDAPDHLPYI